MGEWSEYIKPLERQLLDILGDPNVFPFGPLQYANQEWQDPSLPVKKSISVAKFAGVRVAYGLAY